MLPLQSPTAYCYCYAIRLFCSLLMWLSPMYIPYSSCVIFMRLISFSARHGHRSVVLSTGTVLVMGGRDDSSYRNDVWKTVDSGATWSVVKSNADWGGNQCRVSCSLSVFHMSRRQGCSLIILSLCLSSLCLSSLFVFCRMRTYHQPINFFLFRVFYLPLCCRMTFTHEICVALSDCNVYHN